MRVGLDVHVLTGAPQGTTTVWRAMLGMLPPDDATYILYSFDPEATAAEFPQPHFLHRRIPMRQPHARFQVAYPWLARRDRCDVFHTNYYLPLLGLPGSVVTIHDIIYVDFPEFAPPSRRAQFGGLTRWAATHARAIIPPSEYTRQRLIERWAIDPDRITVVTNALGWEWHAPDEPAIAAAWTRLRPRVPEHFLLGVGRLDPRKNVVTTARVARAVDHPLVWVGGDDFGTQQILDGLRKEGLTIVRLDGLTTVELQAVYRHAAALLFLSLAEGFGYPPIEAMIMGTPTIVSNRTAVPETVGHAALVVDPDNHEQVVDATSQVLTQAHIRQALCTSGRDYAATFSPATMALHTAAIYRSAAEH